MSMVHVHKTFMVFILYCRVTLQVEGLVIKRSVTEVLMEMSCLDIQCDKHQVFHIQVSCIVHTIIYQVTVGANWIWFQNTFMVDACLVTFIFLQSYFFAISELIRSLKFQKGWFWTHTIDFVVFQFCIKIKYR